MSTDNRKPETRLKNYTKSGRSAELLGRVLRESYLPLTPAWGQQQDALELLSLTTCHTINDTKLFWRTVHRAGTPSLCSSEPVSGMLGCCLPVKGEGHVLKEGGPVTKLHAPLLLQKVFRKVEWLEAHFFNNPVFFPYTRYSKSQKVAVPLWLKTH